MSDMIADVNTRSKLSFPFVKTEARGQWPSIIQAITGLDSKYFTSIHQDCPISGCGGKDRFKFDDKDGNGTWYCNHGHGGKNAGDGFNLIEHHLGITPSESLFRVAGYLGLINNNGLTRKNDFITIKKPESAPPKDDKIPRQKVAEFSRTVVDQCVTASTHQYLKAKGLDNTNLPFLVSKERHELTHILNGKPYKQKIFPESLIITIHDLSDINSIIGLQFIPPFISYQEGKWYGKHPKSYVKNTPLKDGVHIIKGDESEYIAIVEGFATGLSVFLATKYTTVVAFDKNSMVAKAERIQALYPNRKLVFFADREGIESASKASQLVMGKVAMPPELDDWNDCHSKYGLELVRDAINSGLSKDIKVFNKSHRHAFIDQFTPIQVITQGGILAVPFIEAIRNYQGYKCFCPITGDKLYIQSSCIYRHEKSKDEKSFSFLPMISYLHDEAVIDEFKKTQNLRRLSKAKTDKDFYAVLQLNSFRMGEQFISIEAIGEFIGSRWSELPEGLKSFFQKLIDAKINKALKHLETDFSRYGETLKLKQDDNGRLDWNPALTVNQPKLTAVKITHGQGKTSEYARKLICQNNYKHPIYLTHRARLAGQASNVTCLNDYRDPVVKKAIKTGLLDDLAMCIHSLTNLDYASQLANSDLIIFDEFSQLIRALVKDKNLKKEAVNTLVSSVKNALKNGAKIVLLDADLSPNDIERCLKLFDINIEDVLVIEGETPNRNYNAHVYPSAGNNRQKSYLIKLARKDIEANIPIVIGCEGADAAKAIETHLKGLFPKKTIKLLTASSVSDEEAKRKNVSSLIENIESESLHWDVVIYTNVIGTGVSIEHKSPRFKKGYFLFSGGVLIPSEWIQMMRRFRDVKEFHVEVYIKPLHRRMASFNKNLGKEEFEKEILEDALFGLDLDIRHESAQLSDISIPAFACQLKHHKITVHGALAGLGETLPIKKVKEDRNQGIFNARKLYNSEYEKLKKQESTGLCFDDQMAVARYEIGIYFKREITINDIEAHENYAVKKGMDIFLRLAREEGLDEKTLIVLKESGISEIIKESLASPVAIGNNKKKELAKKIMKNLKKLKALELAPEHLCKYLKNENYCETTFIKNILNACGCEFEDSSKNRVMVNGSREYQLIIKAPKALHNVLGINQTIYEINPEEKSKEDIRQQVLKLHREGLGRIKISQTIGISQDKIRTIIKNHKASLNT